MSATHPLEQPLLRGLVGLVAEHRLGYAVSVAGILVRHTATILAAVAGAVAVGRAVVDDGSLVAPATVAIGGVVVAAIACWVENYASHALSFRILADLRVDLVSRLARLPRAVLSRSRTGDLATAAGSDAEALEVFFAHSSLYAVASAILSPVLVVVVATWSPEVAVLLLAELLLVLVLPVLLRRRAERHGAQGRRAASALSVEVDETVGSLREVLAFGLEERQRSRVATASDDLAAAKLANAVRSGAESAAATLVVGAAVLGAVAVLAPSLGSGERSLAEVLGLVAVVAAGPGPVLQLVTVTRHWSGTAAAGQRIADLMRLAAPFAGRGGSAMLPDRPLSVSYDRVHFSWPTDHGPVPALRDVSFDVRPGETLALAGASGAGKSTALTLLGTGAVPDCGRVLVGGHDLAELDPTALRDRVSVVPQEAYLFADTLRANLLLGAGADAPSDDELHAALDAAGATEVVAAQPAGLDTVIPSGAGGLSGGERQRLALARALVRRPRLLVLDEAVSQLDAATVAELGRRVLDGSASAGRTTLVVAHRPATLLAADRVVVLVDGRVDDIGTPHELLERCASFRALVDPSATTPTAAPACPSEGAP